MRVAIIGAGLQARRRAPVICDWPDAEIKIITAEHLENASELASSLGCEAGIGWEGIVDRVDIDVVLVLTPPDTHAEISAAAMRAGKHVLCEKPLSRTIKEAEDMIRIARDNRVVLKCGFNHRHHPAIWEAKKLVDQGKIGKPMFARCSYGICGRPGYETEWRADPRRAAGGQFIEQGTHAIDLFRWFLGEVVEVASMTGIQYFKNQPLDDNGMAIFRMKSGATASLHASLTHWKNLFHFEVFGEDGYLTVNGLGASYGTEKLIFGERDFDAPFNYHITEFRGGDRSWVEEWTEFCNSIAEARDPIGSGDDGLAALRIALAAYEAEKSGTVLRL